MRKDLINSLDAKYSVLLDLKDKYKEGNFPKGAVNMRKVTHRSGSGEIKSYLYARHQYRENGRTVQIHVPKNKADELAGIIAKRDRLLNSIKVIEEEISIVIKQLRKYYSKEDIKSFLEIIKKEWEVFKSLNKGFSEKELEEKKN